MADTIEIVQGTATVVEVAGPTGPQGPAGAAGATGAQGPQGVPGTGLEVLTTQGDILYQGASTGQRLPIGSTGQVLKVAGGIPTWGAESGAVTSVAGKTGVVTLDKNDVGLGNVTNAAQVTSVTGTAPIVSSGGTTPAISISAATTSAAGSMSAADKTKLDGIASGAEVNVNADWNASSGDAQILNKPTLGGAAALNVGTTTGTVAAGDDARLSDSRTPTAHAASHAAGTKASYNDQVAGMTENVLIRADTAGTAGNSITLTFDGVDDIDTVLAAWNAANTSNTAELVSGDGAQVPDNLEEITLSGGVAGGSDPIIDARFTTLKINGGEVEFGSPINPNVLPFKVESQDATNTQIAQVLGFDKKGAAFYGTGALGTDGPVVQATHYEVTNSVNFYVNAYGGNVSVGKTTNGAKLDVGGKIRLADTSDGTKQVELSAASIGAGQVRVVTFPNKNITLDDAGDARTPASHTHGNITNDGKLGSTAGLPVVTTTAGAVTTLALGTANQVLRVNSGATGVEFAAASGGGVTGAASSASDVLGVSGSDITGVDAGSADRLVMWDDSASKLTYASVSGMAFDGTTLRAAQVDVYTANDTWNKPSGAKKVEILLIGGGGGGGNGRRGAEGTLRCGGGGGAGGSVVIMLVDANRLNTSETVTIGSGGGGAASVSADDTNGGTGTAGGSTTFSIFTALGGAGGGGGTDTTAGAGAASGSNRVTIFGSISTTNNAGSAGANASATVNGGGSISSPAGGGGGGGRTTTNSGSNGGNGGAVGNSNWGLTNGGNRATGGGENGAASQINYFGSGGGGGQWNGNSPGGNGGNYGAGGGGGGAAVNGAGGSNKGGDGASGVAVITTYF